MTKLRDYQERIADQACALLNEFGIAYLAMQVRTGKTLTAMATADRLLCGTRAERPLVLFLTRKKATDSIMSDYLRFERSYDIAVSNYEQIPNLIKKSLNIAMFILDEAHGLGQYPKPSERTKLLKGWIGRKPVIYLSGTPSPESYSQLFHQFWVSARSPFPERTFYDWSKEYVNVKQKRYSHGLINDYSHAITEKVLAKCDHLIIRFTQEQAGFTQLIEEEVLTVRMKESTYKLAENLIKKRIMTNSDGESVIADTSVKLLGKLHQIYSGSVIVDDPQPHASAFDHTKAEFIRDHFAGQKIAIFYKFKAEAVILRWVFGSRITEVPEEFQAAGTDSVFISQVQSGREGINLSTADALVMMNIDFSAVSYFQSRARLQSKDRVSAAKVYWIFSEGGIEHKIYERVNAKKDYTVSYFKKQYNLDK